MRRVLVIGEQPLSLGNAVCTAAFEAGYEVLTAGLHNEDYRLDLYTSSMKRLGEVLLEAQPQHIVCTAGVNLPEPVGTYDPVDWYRWHFEANVVGPMRLLQAWLPVLSGTMVAPQAARPAHYVAISSNSATIPRTASAAYCASKAALSQALRVKAREAHGGDHGYIVYGYEPGWLDSTPMSDRVLQRFGSTSVTGMHRMRGKSLSGGVSCKGLAAQIVAGLQVPGAALNGALIRYDGGEL